MPMTCRHCSQTAVINMRHHKLALCKDHFIEWVHKQTARFIKNYTMFTPDDRVLVAVSGGKDSLALWDILLTLGYRADGLYIGLGIDGDIGYSDQSYEYVRAFVDQRRDHPAQPRLHVVDVEKVYGASIPEATMRVRREKPCSLCGLSKRHIMNRVARDEGYTVLATGHNLDDEAATLFGNTLTWSVGYLQRQGPVLEAWGTGMVRKVKPLFRFYEREMAAYAFLRGIDYIYEECPFASSATSIRHKELLNDLETTSPGAKTQFYLGFLRARENHGIFMPQDEPITLNSCEKCGQPTTNEGVCSFCRTWDRIRADKAKKAVNQHD
jgi:uncharacterized protein (TIGR00269 family)